MFSYGDRFFCDVPLYQADCIMDYTIGTLLCVPADSFIFTLLEEQTPPHTRSNGEPAADSQTCCYVCHLICLDAARKTQQTHRQWCCVCQSIHSSSRNKVNLSHQPPTKGNPSRRCSPGTRLVESCAYACLLPRKRRRVSHLSTSIDLFIYR